MKKWLLIGAGGILGLLVVGLIALKILFPPEKVKALALAKLEKSLGRPVSLAGDASIGLAGIHLSGLEIPDDGKNDVAQASFASLDARPAWKPLLFKRELQIVHLTLKDGALSYKDRKGKGPTYKLSELSISASDVRLDAIFPAKINFTLDTLEKGKADSRIKLNFAGRIATGNGDLKKALLDADTLVLNSAGIDLKAKGTVKNFSAPEIDLDIALPALAHKKDHPYLDSLPTWLSLPASKGKLLATSGKLLDIKKLTLVGKGLDLKTSVQQTQTGWKVLPTRLAWADIQLDVSGTAAQGKKPTDPQLIDFRLKSNSIDLAKLPKELLKEAPKGLQGKIGLDARVKGPADVPFINGDLKLEKVGLVVSEQDLSELTGRVALTAKRIRGNVQGKLNGEKLNLRLIAKDYSGLRPEYILNGTLAALDLGRLPSAEPAKPGKKPSSPPADSEKNKPSKKATVASEKLVRTSGNITIGKIVHPQFQAGKTSFDWKLTDLDNKLAKIDGRLAFNVGSGKFDKLQALVKDKPLAKLVLMPILILQKTAKKVKILPGFDRVAFKEIVGDYRFNNGKMTVRKSHLDSSIAFAVLSGDADLGRDKLNLHISTKLLGKLGSRISSPVGFKVRGTLANPQVKLDVTSVLKQPGVDRAIKQGTDLIRGLFK
jgi:hypothetical protein